MIPLIFLVEFISFMVRPFSLGLRLFVAMIAGHILMEVFGNFIVSGLNGGPHGDRPQRRRLNPCVRQNILFLSAEPNRCQIPPGAY